MSEREARKEAIERKVGFSIKGRNLVLWLTKKQSADIRRALKTDEPEHVLYEHTLFMNGFGWEMLDSDVLEDATHLDGQQYGQDDFVLSYNVKRNAIHELLSVGRVYVYKAADFGALKEATHQGSITLAGVDIDMAYGCTCCGSDFDDNGVCPNCADDDYDEE